MTSFGESLYDSRRRGGQAISHVDSATATRSAGGATATRAASEESQTPAARADSRDDRNDPGDAPYDWDRLERAVRALAAQQEALTRKVRDLRDQLAERDQTIRVLEARLLEANQRRQDTGKRIDELIAQLDQLDAQLASAEAAE